MKSVYLILLLVACIYARAVEEFDQDSTDIAERPGGDDDPDTGVDHWPWHKDGVAFSAYLSKDLDSLGKAQHIKFDKVLLNDGAGYRPHLGTFRAPHCGVYMFTYVIAQRNKNQVKVNLVRDGKIINGAIADGYHKYQDVQGTNTAIIHVHKGQSVWVEAHSGSRIEGNNGEHRYTTFSGFMLYKRK